MTMNDGKNIIPAETRSALQKVKQPPWCAPMLATLSHKHFSDSDWIFERKLDGVRCLAFRSGNSVRLYSRNKQDLNNTYPEIVDAVSHLAPEQSILDGEIVAFENRITSFSRLQERMQIRSKQKALRSRVRVFYYLFDILYLDNYFITKLPLRLRKKVLKRATEFVDPIRFTTHRNANGEEYLERACQSGWEGLIAKDANAPYVHSRSRHWLKFKCSQRQELVIAGFTNPKGSRPGFGALLLGYYRDGDLTYAGKVGTGFSETRLQKMRAEMDKLRVEHSPLSKGKPTERDLVWIKPELIAEVGFTEWTNDGKLRHPRFIGLRNDKQAKTVRREA